MVSCSNVFASVLWASPPNLSPPRLLVCLSLSVFLVLSSLSVSFRSPLVSPALSPSAKTAVGRNRLFFSLRALGDFLFPSVTPSLNVVSLVLLSDFLCHSVSNPCSFSVWFYLSPSISVSMCARVSVFPSFYLSILSSSLTHSLARSLSVSVSLSLSHSPTD